MTSSFLTNIGYEKPKSEQERFLEAIAPGGDYTMPPDKPKRSREVQPSAGWKNSVAANKEARRLGRQLGPNGASAYYGPGGDPTGSGRGQAQQRSGKVGLMGPDGKPFDPTRKPQTSSTGRNEVRSSGTGTRTGPAPAKFDGTEGMDAFIAKLQGADYGITFGGQGGRTPMESVSLPDTSTGKMVSITNGANAGKYVSVNDPDFDSIVRGDKEGGTAGQQTTGGGVEEITTTKTGGATTGRMGDALGDKSGMRSYMDRVIKEGRENASDEGPMAYANDGLDARSRAFLDYEGKGGSLMALRAADAAQNTVYAGGKLYDVSGKNSEGKYDTIGSEMRGYLKENRNEQAGGQAYKDYYQNNVLTTEDSKSSDSVAPGYSSRADYQQLSQRDMGGTLVMGSDNKPEPFERNVNQSYITGSPGQDIYNTTKNPFVDRQEPPTTGFLPDEETAETIKRFYIK